MKIVNDIEVYEPNECYFQADCDEIEMTVISIVPINYFNKNNCLDDSIGEDSFENDVLPLDDYECVTNLTDGTWTSHLSLAEVK